eukprot:127261-Prymnesium_polylepis.1
MRPATRRRAPRAAWSASTRWAAWLRRAGRGLAHRPGSCEEPEVPRSVARWRSLVTRSADLSVVWNVGDNLQPLRADAALRRLGSARRFHAAGSSVFGGAVRARGAEAAASAGRAGRAGPAGARLQLPRWLVALPRVD